MVYCEANNKLIDKPFTKIFIFLQNAMRRVGQNPTDVEVLDIINKIDDGSGHLNFEVS